MKSLSFLSRFGVTVFALGSLVISSCGSKTDLKAEEAATNLMSGTSPDMVFAFKGKDLLDKSGMSSGEVMPAAFKMLFNEVVEYFTNEEKTGISMEGRSFLMAKLGKKEVTMVAVFNLKDPEVFAKMIREEMETEPAEKDGYHYVVSPDNDAAISWYKTYGLMVVKPDFRGSKEEIIAVMDEHMKKSIEKGELNPSYESFLKEDTDFSMLMRLEPVMEMAKNEARGDEKKMMQNMAEMYKDCYTIYTLNFETDKIVGKIKNHLSDKTGNRFKSMMANGVSPDYMNYLTNDDLFGFFTVALNSTPVYEFVKELGGEEFAEEEDRFEQKSGMKISDLLGAFTGEFAMSMSGMSNDSVTIDIPKEVDDKGNVIYEGESYTYNRPRPQFNMVIGLKNDLIKNILDTVKETEKIENYYKASDEFYFTFTGNKLFASSEEANVKQVASTGQLKPYTAGGVEKKATQKAGFGYFDFKYMLSSIPDKEAQDLFSGLDHAVAYGDVNEMTFELNLKKSGKNSLFVITEAIMNTYFAFSL